MVLLSLTVDAVQVTNAVKAPFCNSVPVERLLSVSVTCLEMTVLVSLLQLVHTERI